MKFWTSSLRTARDLRTEKMSFQGSEILFSVNRSLALKKESKTCDRGKLENPLVMVLTTLKVLNPYVNSLDHTKQSFGLFRNNCGLAHKVTR